ncbi:MAG: choice-of-anchor S family protein [Candidatus Hermodarchaeota archaeon]
MNFNFTNEINAKVTYFAVLIVIILVSLVFTSPMSVSGSLGVSPGDSFSYTVTKFTQSISYGSRSVAYNEFIIANSSDRYTAGTVFNIEVLEINEDFIPLVLYEVTKDTNSINATGSIFGLIVFPLYLLIPMFLILLVNTNVPPNDEVETQEPVLTDLATFIPYILPTNGTTDALWSSFEDFENETTTEVGDEGSLTLKAYYTKTDGNFEFGYLFFGTITNNANNNTLTVNSEMRVVYEMATGVLQGFSFLIDSFGTIVSQSFEMDYQIQIVRQGFIGFGATPGFEFIILFIGLLAVSSLYLVQKRRKKVSLLGFL